MTEQTSDTKKEAAGTRASRTRSPAYPAYNLESCLEKAKLIWQHEKRNAAPVAVIASAWELNPKSSSVGLYVSSLKKFGLLDEVEGGSERGLRLSQATLNIILNEQEDSPERIALLKQCALTPKIHAELWQKYNGELPSDANVKRYLIVEKNFNADAVDVFIKQFKDTITFAKLERSDKITVVEPEESEQPQETLKTQQKTDPKIGELLGAPLSPSQPSSLQEFAKLGGLFAAGSTLTGAMAVLREFTVPLTSGAVSLRVPYPMEDEDFQLFMDTLKLWKKRLVRTPKAIPPKIAFPANAMWEQNDGSHKPVKVVGVMGEKDGEWYYQSEDGTGLPASQLKF